MNGGLWRMQIPPHNARPWRLHIRGEGDSHGLEQESTCVRDAGIGPVVLHGCSPVHYMSN